MKGRILGNSMDSYEARKFLSFFLLQLDGVSIYVEVGSKFMAILCHFVHYDLCI